MLELAGRGGLKVKGTVDPFVNTHPWESTVTVVEQDLWIVMVTTGTPALPVNTLNCLVSMLAGMAYVMVERQGLKRAWSAREAASGGAWRLACCKAKVKGNANGENIEADSWCNSSRVVVGPSHSDHIDMSMHSRAKQWLELRLWDSCSPPNLAISRSKVSSECMSSPF